MGKKPLLVLTVVVAGALGFARWWTGDSEASDPGLVLDRIWVDQLPRKPKDTANVFVAVRRESLGIFQSVSQWKGSYEIFNYRASGNQLRLLYPQTDETEQVKVRAWTCNERDMDYCLELSGASRGVKRYRSRKGMEIGEATRPDQLLDRVAAIVRLRTP